MKGCDNGIREGGKEVDRRGGELLVKRGVLVSKGCAPFFWTITLFYFMVYVFIYILLIV